MSPVFAQDVEADVRNAVLVSRVLSDEALDQVEVLIEGVNLRIACPLKNLLLQEERRAVDLVDDLLAVCKAVVRDDVKDVIAIFILIDETCLLRLDVGPEARCLLGRDIVFSSRSPARNSNSKETPNSSLIF